MLTVIKIFFISLFSPIKTARKFSLKKVKVLFNALKYESSGQIIANFRRYIEGNHEASPVSNNTADLFSVKERILRDKRKEFDAFLRSGSTLSFQGADPVLSIVTVFFNQAGLSYACLKSILKNVSVKYELIIIDNHSTDDTNLLLDRIEGATVIRNNKNLHFLKANNQALDYVRGKYLLFLNNDTELTESTISSAMDTLDGREKCGAVGGKLILPDGTLQEAGSMIWNDGSCLGYGRHESPDLPEFNFKRVTDYCSGAFLLTYTDLFREHGGFDPTLAPAYYEETDYCLWLQEKGLDVIYDPEALVFHYEFASSMSQEGTTLQRINQRKFYRKHQRQLSKHFKYDLGNVLKARFAASQRYKKKVLYIDDRVPHRDQGAGFPRSNSILKLIRELDYDLTVYPLNFPNEDNWMTAYRDVDPFIEIIRGRGVDGFERFIHSRADYFDIIWISRPHNMEALIKDIRFLKGRSKIIYDVEAIAADRDILLKELNGKMYTEEKKAKWYEKEIQLSIIADRIITVSEADAEKFKRFGRSNIVVLGHIMEINKTIAGFNERNGLLFVGNLDDDASPNVDSVLWFIHDIFPIIRQEIPDMTVDIVGSDDSPKIRSLHHEEGVYIHGRVSSLSDFYNTRRVFIAPTRFAAGIPYKIHEASSFGLPVVATRLLCEQLGWRHQQEVLASKIDKFDFARHVIDLYHHEDLWNLLQKNAMNLIRRQMSVDAYKKKIAEILI